MTDLGDTQLQVLIIDDHVMVRAGLRMLIEQDPGLCVVGECGDLSEAVPLAERSDPDVILLDLDVNGRNGLDVLPDLLAVARQARVLVLTGSRNIDSHRDAMRRGASGVLVKDHAGEVLIKAIRKVQEGEVWLDRLTMGLVFSDMRVSTTQAASDPDQAKIATLSEREKEVVTLVCEGLKNRTIADRLFISEHTVRHHLGSIFAKLDVSSRLALMHFAYRHRLAKPPA